MAKYLTGSEVNTICGSSLSSNKYVTHDEVVNTGKAKNVSHSGTGFITSCEKKGDEYFIYLSYNLDLSGSSAFLSVSWYSNPVIRQEVDIPTFSLSVLAEISFIGYSGYRPGGTLSASVDQNNSSDSDSISPSDPSDFISWYMNGSESAMGPGDGSVSENSAGDKFTFRY
jgi:hypothetical protein